MKIAVTGLNNVDNPGPGVPVIRGIRDSGKFDAEIIGLIYDALEPGAYMQEVADKNYLIPYPSSGLDNLFQRLDYINKVENIDVLIPTLDAELYAFSKLSPKLEALGIRTFLPTKEQLDLRAKDKLFSFCSKNGIKVPENILATTIQDLYSMPSKLKYPVVVKGIFYDAYVANNFDEAVSVFNKINTKWGLPIIIQEFIQGDEYNVAALGDGTGYTIGAVGMRKLYITDKGKGWSGISVSDPSLIKLSENIIEKLKWKSGAELEFIKEKESNEYYLVEINPRFPAWIYLSVATGQNLPAALVDLALGNDVEKMPPYEVGKIFIRYSWDLITDIKKFEQITVNGELYNG